MKYDLKYEFCKIKEKILLFIVWHLPRRIVYWASIRLMAHATAVPCNGEYDVVPKMTAMDALDRWDKP